MTTPSREAHRITNLSALGQPFTPTSPLWCVAAYFWRPDEEPDRLVCAIDSTPVLALANYGHRTAALILHQDHPAPVWVAPSTFAMRQLKTLLSDSDCTDGIHISRIVAEKPIPGAPLADLVLTPGFFLYNQEWADAFDIEDNQVGDELCWDDLS